MVIVPVPVAIAVSVAFTGLVKPVDHGTDDVGIRGMETLSNLSVTRLMSSNILALANNSTGFGGRGPLVKTVKPTIRIAWAMSEGRVLPVR